MRASQAPGLRNDAHLLRASTGHEAQAASRIPVPARLVAAPRRARRARPKRSTPHHPHTGFRFISGRPLRGATHPIWVT